MINTERMTWHGSELIGSAYGIVAKGIEMEGKRVEKAKSKLNPAQDLTFTGDTKDLLIRDIRALEKRAGLLGLNLTRLALDEAVDEATHENSTGGDDGRTD